MDKAPQMKAQGAREVPLSQVLRLPWRMARSFDGVRDPSSTNEKQLILCDIEDPVTTVIIIEVSSGLGPHIVQAHNELIKRQDLLLKEAQRALQEPGGTLA